MASSDHQAPLHEVAAVDGLKRQHRSLQHEPGLLQPGHASTTASHDGDSQKQQPAKAALAGQILPQPVTCNPDAANSSRATSTREPLRTIQEPGRSPFPSTSSPGGIPFANTSPALQTSRRRQQQRQLEAHAALTATQLKDTMAAEDAPPARCSSAYQAPLQADTAQQDRLEGHQGMHTEDAVRCDVRELSSGMASVHTPSATSQKLSRLKAARLASKAAEVGCCKALYDRFLHSVITNIIGTQPMQVAVP